jgi:hypothetical protein
MKKMRLAFIGLFVTTVVWTIAVGFAFASNHSTTPKPTTPRAALGAGPDDCYIRTFKVFPTENSSEWRHIYIVRGNVVFINETWYGEYQGELTEPLHEYVREAIENPYYLIRFTDEEFDSVPVKTYDVYKFEDSYYWFEKTDLDGRFIDAVHPETAYSIIYSQQIYPPTVGSGITLLGCWVGLGAYAVKQDRRKQ